ncbi:MAG: O-methyltransferase [Clostridia bacterium]|nr:O-methyltransferase [Clostridia bacterium]
MALDCLIDPVTERYLRSLPSLLPESLRELEEFVRSEQLPVSSKEAIEMLIFLCTVHKPKRILEIGTFVGFSALTMSAVCPEAALDTIERNPVMVSDAKQNFQRFDAKNVTLFEGDAAVILPNLSGTYDLIYLDAAKGQYPAYLPQCIRLLAEGGILISDDVLFRGQVSAGKPDCHRNQTIVNRLDEYLHLLKTDPRLTTTVLPISDGVALSVKRRGVLDEKA